MMCAWKELVSILPMKIRREVDSLGKESMQELRLRMGAPPELVLQGGSRWLSVPVSREDLAFVVNTATRYSPWAAATMAQGYITAPGGHRIGICGEAVCRSGAMDGFREISSLCIRIARDYPGIAKQIAVGRGSILILGAPGWGKSTLLRDLSRKLADVEWVSVVDERGELFPSGFQRGRRMDVLTGCPKPLGMDMVLRTMGPHTIAVDEVTAQEDCLAMVQAANCGVRLLATAHASSLQDLRTREVYRKLLEHRIFDTVVILRKDKSFTVERMA